MKAFLELHARSLWLLVALFTLGGVIFAFKMPVSLFPPINYPRVIVSVDAGERDAAQMAAEITRPIEIALRSVPGVVRVRSTTSRGAAQIALNFSWGDDMVAALLATQGALATLASELPTGIRFDVRRSDPTIFPVLGLALTSDTLDQQALRQLAELKLRPALTAVPGVAAVDILGGSPRELAVDVDLGKLQGFGLGIDDVTAALAGANTVAGVGKMEDRHRLYLVLVEGRLTSAQALATTPVKPAGTDGLGLVTLAQVASISTAAEPNFTRVTSDGQRAVLVNIRQSLRGDSVAIVKSVSARLQSLSLPATVKVTPFYDQSELVTGAADAVAEAILLGSLLAGVVLLYFLRSTRLMLITALMLPGVLLATCLALFALGMGFNMMTLGGMAAAVGLIVDDAVVVFEHMMRQLQDGKARDSKSLLQAAAEMERPLLGSTLATIIVFLPLSFISGVSGGFFTALAITMVLSLLFSLFYARCVIPLVAAHWLTAHDAEQAEKANVAMQRLGRHYLRWYQGLLSKPRMFVFSTLLLLVFGGALAWTQMKSGFMPTMDEGGFVLDYKAHSGAALADTDSLLAHVEQLITATPEVASYSRRTGIQLGGGLTEADEGDYFIRLHTGSRRPIAQVMEELRTKIETQVPGVQVELTQLMEDLIGDLTAVPQPIEVKLFSDDPEQLANSATQVAAALKQVEGVVEIVDGLRIAGDAITVKVDAGLAAQQGLDASKIAEQLQQLLGGRTATRIRFGEQLVGVRVRAEPGLRSRTAQLGSLPLTAADGHIVQLRQVADIASDAGQRQLTREDLAPFVAVTARLEGRDLGSAMRAVRATVTQLQLPPGVRVDYGGLYAEQQKSFADMALVFAAALLLSALLLTLLFERLLWTIAAIATVLLSVAAVLLGLWLTHTELNISALMGLTMVVGMVTELIIFYLSEINRSQALAIPHLREVGLNRLRPILMSALIAILTLSPLALSISRGAGLQQPLATAIIFGLLAAVPLVLLFLPALLTLLQPKPAD